MPKRKRKVRKIGVNAASAVVARHMLERPLIKKSLKEFTKPFEKRHQVKVFPWTHMTLAMEFWRRLNKITLKEFREKKTAEWISLYNTHLSLGDLKLEYEMGAGHPDKQVQGLKFNSSRIKKIWDDDYALHSRFNLMGKDFQNIVNNMIEWAAPSEQAAGAAIKRLRYGITSGIQSVTLEKKYGWDATPEHYNEILKKKTYDIGYNFLKAASIVHGIDGEESDKVNHALAGLMMYAMAYDDLNDLKADFKKQPNLIVSLAKANGELNKLSKGIKRDKIPHGKRRLRWVERNMPDTYNAFRDHIHEQKQLARPFFTDRVMDWYASYVMSKSLKKLKLR